MNGKPKVLLTANYGPNELVGGEDAYNLMSTRWTRGHGDFRLDMYGHYFALYLIAENLSCPTTVLENPNWEEFDRELDNGYDFIGFQLKSVHTAKVARMMKRIREKSPNTKIVVGGYGVGTLAAPVPGDKNGDAIYIRENADYLCREEGVRFMRRLVGDENVEREITQYHTPMFSLSGFTGGKGVHIRIPTILVSLGCPNGCDFCNTSAFYKQKKIYVAEPEQVYRWIRNYQKRMGFKEIIVMLWDEDFFINKEYVNELGRLLRSHKSTWCVRYYTFGSIRSLSQYTAEEIRDNGCEFIWIGVESFQLENQTDAYGKRAGRSVTETINDLQKHGVQVTGSMCVGFDFHTRENLKDDIDKFVALKPMFYQISHVLPCPGTALYDRMAEAGDIRDGYRWEDLHFWSDHIINYKNISQEDIKELFKYAHDQLANENGPPTLQLMESMLDAYRIYRDDPDPYRQALAKRERLIVTGLSAALPSVKNLHPSPKVRERAAMLEARFHEEVGASPMAARAIAHYISHNMKKKIDGPKSNAISDPPPRWTYYNTYGDDVWVKKGREQKNPEPYSEGSFLDGPQLRPVLDLIGMGRRGIKNIREFVR